MHPRSARICGPAARSLADVVERGAGVNDGDGNRTHLSTLVARMQPADAADIISAALKRGSIPRGLRALARLLSATLYRLDDSEADRVCEQLLGPLDCMSLAAIAPELLEHLNPERAHELAWDLASRMCAEPEFDSEVFSRILTDTGRARRALRATRGCRLTGPGLEGALKAAVRDLAEPFPCRLTTEELVELLKMPTCFGRAHRVVLDHLGNRYRRRFVNHWAFVRFAMGRKLELDFTTPPKRPNPK